MKLNTITIPTFDENHQPRPNLTLIHGWAAESRVWEKWVKENFSAEYSITLIDLPGFGDSEDIEKSPQLMDNWINALVEVMPQQTHLLGWSLGGLLAQQIALRYPSRIQSLICLATTPRFTQNDGWKRSVSPQIIIDFIQAMSVEVSSVLKKFWRLQLQGTENARVLMKELGKHMANRTIPTFNALNQGLILLIEMDNRQQLHELKMPTLWLLGENDPLIPQEIRSNLHELQPNAQIEVIPGGSHIPFFSQPDETADYILNFLRQH